MLLQKCNGDIKKSSWGKDVICRKGDVLDSLCESGKAADCDHSFNKINCCNHGVALDNSKKCDWERKWYGVSANCGEGYVMAGACGSGNNLDCPHNSAHGAYCCPLKRMKGMDFLSLN